MLENPHRGDTSTSQEHPQKIEESQIDHLTKRRIYIIIGKSPIVSYIESEWKETR